MSRSCSTNKTNGIPKQWVSTTLSCGLLICHVLNWLSGLHDELLMNVFSCKHPLFNHQSMRVSSRKTFHYGHWEDHFRLSLCEFEPSQWCHSPSKSRMMQILSCRSQSWWEVGRYVLNIIAEIFLHSREEFAITPAGMCMKGHFASYFLRYTQIPSTIIRIAFHPSIGQLFE
jgi:hypothetical protein